MRTITAPVDGTMMIEGTAVQIDGVISFQNISHYEIRWSKAPFSDTNIGRVLLPYEERVLSSADSVYFMASRPSMLQVASTLA